MVVQHRLDKFYYKIDSGALAAIVGPINNEIDRLGAKLESTVDGAGQIIQGKLDSTKQLATSAITGIVADAKSDMQNSISILDSTVSNMANEIIQMKQTLIGDLDTLQADMDSVANQAVAGIENGEHNMDNIAKSMRTAVLSSVSNVESAGAATVASITNTIATVESKLTNMDITTRLTNSVSTEILHITTSVHNLLNAFEGRMTTLYAKSEALITKMIAEAADLKRDITKHVGTEITRVEEALTKARNETSDIVGTGVRQIEASTESLLRTVKYDGENSIKSATSDAKDVYETIFKLLKTYIIIFLILIVCVIIISMTIYFVVIRPMNNIKLTRS